MASNPGRTLWRGSNSMSDVPKAHIHQFNMASLIPEFPDAAEVLRSRFAHNFSDTFGQHIFHSHNAQQAPSFDISETDSAYLLDGNFPGLCKKSNIKVRCAGKRTLVVEAHVPKPDYETLWQTSFGHKIERIQNSGDGAASGVHVDGNGKGAHGVAPGFSDLIPSLRRSRSCAGETGVREWVRERHTGQLYRTFTFPDDVETGSVKAILHQAQLNLMITKSEPVHSGNREIFIGDI
ncbi:hypothetical protein LTR86_011061 [Recurvomyces mirabilis]|nr:hypothetical protein LTR86_011061 [Recurvomyces mirabilis]